MSDPPFLVGLNPGVYWFGYNSLMVILMLHACNVSRLICTINDFGMTHWRLPLKETLHPSNMAQSITMQWDNLRVWGGSKFHLWPAHAVRSKMLSGGVVAWGDADSGGDCSWLSAELQDVQVLSTVGLSMEFLGGPFGSTRVIVAHD